ncbi:OprD family outer membrane porin [Sulfuricurvum sp.]|uniref:OprD family outer membrane porin n=1 Tax=Sulfuricurvum sp. TaxID=2025608 RepID=UPI00260B5ADB|nr:OprD family outer membrane porin [Sulfuricurvum sp.]MDD4883824.1 OprD family outer membrane porin [Sulfuricurvum sp.]
MKTRLSIGGVAFLIGSAAFSADSLVSALNEGHFSGGVRALYAQTYNDVGDDRYGTGIGLRLSYETASLYGVQAKVTMFSASGLGLNSGNPNEVESIFFENDQSKQSRDAFGRVNTVYGSGADSYAVLGEAYLKATFGKTFIQIGRMMVDAPFASSHDIYLVPNTFEAAQIVNVNIPDMTLVLSHATRMSGPDMVQSNSFAGSSQNVKASDFVSISRASSFEGLADGDGDLTTEKDNAGATVAGAIYTGISGLILQGWFYRVWDVMDMPHLQADYHLKAADTDLFAGVQWASQKAIGGTKDTLAHPVAGSPLIALGIDNIDAYHYEAKMGVSYAGATLTAAYANTRGVSGNAARGGFVSPVGGNASWVRTRYQSPHFGFTDTSCYTGGTDAYSLGAEYDFGYAGLEGLKGGLKYLFFNRDNQYSSSSGLLYYKPNAYQDTNAIEASLDYEKLFGVKGFDGGITLLSVDNDDAAGNASTDHTDLRVALNLMF